MVLYFLIIKGGEPIGKGLAHFDLEVESYICLASCVAGCRKCQEIKVHKLIA